MKKLLIILCLITNTIYANEHEVISCGNTRVSVETKDGYFAKCIEHERKIVILKKFYSVYVPKDFPYGKCKKNLCRFRENQNEPFNVAFTRNCQEIGFDGPVCSVYECIFKKENDTKRYIATFSVNRETGEVNGWCE